MYIKNIFFYACTCTERLHEICSAVVHDIPVVFLTFDNVLMEAEHICLQL